MQNSGHPLASQGCTTCGAALRAGAGVLPLAQPASPYWPLAHALGVQKSKGSSGKMAEWLLRQFGRLVPNKDCWFDSNFFRILLLRGALGE